MPSESDNAKFEKELRELRAEKGLAPTQSVRGDLGSAAFQTPENVKQRFVDEQVKRASDWYSRQQPKQPMRFDEADIRDSLPDAFLLRSGLPVHHATHPMAAWAAALSLPQLADQCRAGLTSSEFGMAMSHGFSQIVATTYDSTDFAGPLCWDLEVPNFQPVQFPKADIVDLQQVATTGNGISSIPLQTMVLSGTESGSINTYRARVHISRQLLISDSFHLITALMQQLASQAGRLPMQLIGAILTANANLADSQPLLGSDNITAAGLDVTALAAAADNLHNRVSPAGNILNSTPRIWLLRPEHEMQARVTLKTVELNARSEIQPIICPWLPSGYSYLLCDPSENATFVRLLFQKPLRPSVTSGPLPIEMDGVYLDFSVDFGLKAVSRLGIVQIPVQ